MNSILVELKANPSTSTDLPIIERELQKEAPSFVIDRDYPAIEMMDDHNELQSYLVRGRIEETQMNQLKISNLVVKVLSDTSISPFD